MILLYHGSNVAIENKGDHAIQYFFGTPQAIRLLKRIES